MLLALWSGVQCHWLSLVGFKCVNQSTAWSVSEMNEPVKGRADGQRRGDGYPVCPAIFCSASTVEVRLWVARGVRQGAEHAHLLPLQIDHSISESFRCGGTDVWPSAPSFWLQHVKQCLTAVSSLLPPGIQIREDLSYQLGLCYSAEFWQNSLQRLQFGCRATTATDRTSW